MAISTGISLQICENCWHIVCESSCDDSAVILCYHCIRTDLETGVSLMAARDPATQVKG